MATTTTHSSSTMAASACSATATNGTRAPEQGIIMHSNPSVYDPSSPIVMFIIQAAIIILLCRLLHYPLKLLRQPRVISEVIGGIILGPSVMGHIPGFTNAIFPTASIPNLSLAANLGLVLFLFLVGLEADFRFLVSNWKSAVSVGAAGMALPFGCGAAIAWGLYNQFRTDSGLVPISFGTYLLFIAVAMAITAFPVLCRILTELKLLHTPVGIIVLSAGVANDVVGWILLALCVALANASSGLIALYVLLVAVAWILFLVYLVRPAFVWVLRKSGSIENGPTQGIVALTLIMVLTSAFFTQVIGIHAIFGAFLMGLIIPHDGGFAIKMAEKIEDLVCALFLPLYFALSGLSTNLGLLNSGITWAYVIGVLAIAFVTKISGGAIAARLTGRVWRESFTIGSLMSCKGLVELIVLNIGLQAKILSTTTFTIFVVMALITTFTTTPLVLALYPPSYQAKLQAWQRGEIDWDGNRLAGEDKPEDDSASFSKSSKTEVSRLLVHLRLDTMPGVLALVAMFSRPLSKDTGATVHPSKRTVETDDSPPSHQRPLQVHGIRLKELTERESSVMTVTELEDYSQHDHVLNTFRTFGQLRNVAVRGKVLLCPPETFSSTLVESAGSVSADLMLLSWSASGSISENQILPAESIQQRFDNSAFSQFASKALSQHTNCNTAMFVDNGFGSRRNAHAGLSARTHTVRSLHDLAISAVPPTLPPVDPGHHIFVPFFGTQDDLVALHLVLQLAQDSTVTATIALFETAPESTAATSPQQSKPALTTFYTLRDSLPPTLAERVLFETISVPSSPDVSTSSDTATLAAEVLAKAKSEVGRSLKNAGDLIVLGRNLALDSELGRGRRGNESWIESDAGRTLGGLAGALIHAEGTSAVGLGIGASLVVVKAAE